MSNYAIIADSGCDLSKDLRERFGVDDILHGTVYFPDGHTEPSDIDWERMTPEQFYKSMSGRKVLYKTATFAEEEGYSVMERHMKEGRDVLFISLSSALSGTYQLGILIAKELTEKYPERKIICVDSLRYSTAFAMLVMLACQKRDSGADIDECAQYVNETKLRIHQMGCMDDLFFLVKTGRVSNFQAFFGSMVGINPMADFNEKGLCEVIYKAKGKKSALDATIKYIKALAKDPGEQTMFIAHSDRKAAADALRTMIEKEIAPREIITLPVGMSCGCSIGPGLCAAFFLGDAVSPDLSKEKETLAQIFGK